jgi:hypothetical protein
MRRLRRHSEDTSMKAFAILPAVAVVILALNISSASSQGNSCGKEYQACMDSCAVRSSKSMQDSCFTSCEGKNNLCSESVYGKRPVNGSAPVTAAAPKVQTQAKNALAKKEKAQDAPQEQPVAEQPQQKDAPQAQPEPAKSKH